MRTITVHSFEHWRREARRLVAARVGPDGVHWTDGQDARQPLPFADAAQAPAPSRGDDPADDVATAHFPASGAMPRVPRRFVALAQDAALHRNTGRWAVMYRVLWRLTHDERTLLDHEADPDVRALTQMAAEVRRDDHKMRAFVRFTPVSEDGVTRSVAYYRPDHHIVQRVAPFFVDRFASLHWSILTPDLSVHWDGRELEYSPGVSEGPATDHDHEVEALWRTYYTSMFNPARANLRATLREMPVRRWQGLPEAREIPHLLATAHERTLALPASGDAGARPFVPHTGELAVLRDAAPLCRGCPLVLRATQVVFGEGPRDARLVLVGEQPGDVEDRRGHPFVGPAGEVLDRALAAAGLDRQSVYVTNAVKHFSFEERGKRRIHKTPRQTEVRACRPWLEAELQAIQPLCVVCLGATAASSLLGPGARVNALRGKPIASTAWARSVIVTVHPSAVLRADDGAAYFEMIVSDLRLAAAQLPR